MPFFFKKMSLPHISFCHLVEVMSFVVFWDSFEGDRVLSLEFGRRGMLVFLVFWVFVALLQVKGLLVDRHIALLQVKGLLVIVFGVLLHALPFFFSERGIIKG